MRFDVITLFPELFAAPLSLGVTRRAFLDGGVDVKLWSLRDHADEPHRRVDDRPYGGGPGMVMLHAPLERALAAARVSRRASVSAAGSASTSGSSSAAADVPVVHFTPTGQRLTQGLVEAFASGPGAVLVCGRYEGIDQRFLDRHVDVEISLGDFVLSGGELPALVLLDAVARLQEGVLHDPQSHRQDSFSEGLLDCPHYSRPESLGETDGAVPDVLLSGHHGAIARWRRERSLELTARRRPDLLVAARAAGRLDPSDELYLSRLGL